MADHRLQKGRALIEALSELGEALGYQVSREHPIGHDGARAPAVDVAWMGEGNESPLMIFEVETRATNSAANNAVKVFGPNSSSVVKPLYFFHVFLTKTSGSRLHALSDLLSSHNYRAFDLGQEPAFHLLEAILAQHRRVRGDLELQKLLGLLGLEPWTTVDLSAVLGAVAQLRFKADYVGVLSRRARLGERELALFVGWLSEQGGLEFECQDEAVTYGSAVGYWWAYPLHCGLVGAALPSRSAEMAERVRHWQSYSSYMTMIGPHYGLSPDYDELMIGAAPAFCAALGALIPELVPEMLTVLGQVREPLRGAFAAPNALWSLHLASSIGEAKAFEAARVLLNDLGGVSSGLLYCPELLFSASGDATWLEQFYAEQVEVPPMAAFRAAVLARLPLGTHPSAAETALALLNEDCPDTAAALPLVAALADRSA